jgi:MSHA pilin protein MshD
LTAVRQTGATLIELVTSIVILAIAIGGVMLALTTTIGRSADPMIQQQASAIAQAYLEEILLQSFCDPDLSSDCPTACAAGNACGNASCHAGGEARPDFDDVCDYDGLSQPATDRTGAAIAELNDYTVSVAVIDAAGANLNGLTGGSQSLRIDVTVSNPAMQPSSIVLTAYKANY